LAKIDSWRDVGVTKTTYSSVICGYYVKEQRGSVITDVLAEDNSSEGRHLCGERSSSQWQTAIWDVVCFKAKGNATK
jgi:hypothetical protein